MPSELCYNTFGLYTVRCALDAELRHYLSFGGGVNSVALLLWLLDRREDFEAVFAHHATDWPETYQYLEMLQAWLSERGYREITVLDTRREGLTLYDYYLKHRMIPMRMQRACTRLYKLVPLAEYMKPPCVVYLGIDAGEDRRVQRIVDGQRPGEDKQFPLLEHGIDRQGCIDIIKAHGLPVPIKSGCYICPFMRVGQIRQLYREHSDLFCKLRRLELVTNKRLAEQGRKPIRIFDKPLLTIAKAQEVDMFTEQVDTPCLCEL